MTYSDKVYNNFCGLNVPENGLDCESFRIISTDSLFVHENKYYLQVYLDSPAHKIVDKQLIDLIIIFVLIKIIFFGFDKWVL